jgi:DNA-directed RNA polymerase specialized sigma24 family protein
VDCNGLEVSVDYCKCQNARRIDQALCTCILAAQIHRVPDADVEACALEFVQTLLEGNRWIRWEASEFSARWLAVCARNFTRNFLAGLRRQQAKLLPLEATELGNSTCSAQGSLDSYACSLEIRYSLQRALSTLSSRQRRYLSRRFLDGWTVSDIASLERETPQTVCMVIKRARDSMRRSLVEIGFDADEALRYLGLAGRQRIVRARSTAANTKQADR